MQVVGKNRFARYRRITEGLRGGLVYSEFAVREYSHSPRQVKQPGVKTYRHDWTDCSHIGETLDKLPRNTPTSWTKWTGTCLLCTQVFPSLTLPYPMSDMPDEPIPSHTMTYRQARDTCKPGHTDPSSTATKQDIPDQAKGDRPRHSARREMEWSANQDKLGQARTVTANVGKLGRRPSCESGHTWTN